jgi:hypothetical protein
MKKSIKNRPVFSELHGWGRLVKSLEGLKYHLIQFQTGREWVSNSYLIINQNP